jgi:hypothetical protein
LEGFSVAREGDDRTLVAVMLSEALAPLARGEAASAVDAAVRRHFAMRKAGDEYALVDDALNMALEGTPYAVVKAAVRAGGGLGITKGTLVGCLDHPEPAVRLAAVSRVGEQEDVGGVGAEAVSAALLRRVEMDEDATVVEATLRLPGLVGACGAEEVLRALGGRLLKGSRGMSEADACSVYLAGLAVLGRLVQRMEEGGATTASDVAGRVLALLVALSAAELLPVEASDVQSATLEVLQGVGGVGCSLMDVDDVTEGRGKEDAEEKPEDGDVAMAGEEKPVKRREKKSGKMKLEAKLRKRKKATVTCDLKRNFLADALAYSKFTPAIEELLFGVREWNGDAALKLMAHCMRLSRVGCEFTARVLEMALDDGDRVALLAALWSLRELSPLPSELLLRVWEHGKQHNDSQVLDEVAGVLLCRSAEAENAAAVKFLQARGGDIVALEMLCGLCLGKRAAVSDVIVAVVSAAYGSDAKVRKAARGIGKTFAAEFLRQQAHEVAGGAVEGADVVRALKDALGKPSKAHDGSCQWRGRDVVSQNLEKARAAVYGRVPAPLDVGDNVTFKDAVRTILSDACVEKPWHMVVGMLRACSDVPFGEADEDAALLEQLLARDDKASDPASADECLTLAVARLLGDGAKLLSAKAGKSLVSALAVGDRSEVEVCLLVDLALAFSMPANPRASSMTKVAQTKEATPLHSQVVDILLRAAAGSSSSGNLAGSLLVQCDGLFSPHDCIRVLDGLAREVPAASTAASSKRARRDGDLDHESIRASGVAALEVLSRFQLSNLPLELSTAAAPGLWSLVQNIGALAAADVDSVTETLQYQMQLALRVLAVVFARDRVGHSGSQKDTELHVDPAEAQAAVDAVSYGRAEEAMDAAIRTSAVSLVVALAEHPGAALQDRVVPVLEVLVQSSDNGLMAVLPPLIAKGLSAAQFIPQITVAAGQAHQAALACAIGACPDRVEALALALDVFEDDAVAAALMSKCRLTIAEQLSALAHKPRPALALARLTHPDLFMAIGKGETLKEEAAFLSLFDTLICVDGADEALGAVLGLMSADLLARSVQHATSKDHALQALRVLSRSLGTADVLRGELKSLLAVLVDLMESPSMQTDERQAAVVALEKLNRAIGKTSVDKDDLVAAATRCAALFDSDGVASALSASTVLCVASFVETLGPAVATLVPRLANASLSLVEKVLLDEESISDSSDDDESDAEEGASGTIVMAEAGIRACQSILVHLPAFFGQTALGRIAVLTVKVNFQVLQDLLDQAVVCVKPVAVIGALTSALDACSSNEDDENDEDDEEERRKRIERVMKTLATGVDGMRKSEVKAHKLELFQLCLRGVEMNSSVALLTLVLRLPETEFQGVYHKLLQWVEAGYEERAASFYTAIGALFDTLRSLMVPYFALAIDRALKSGGGPGGPGALSCVAQFLRHADDGSASVTLVTRVKDGILAAFDAGEEIGDACASLAARIVALGPGEESRQLLCAAARGLLLRSRADRPVVRVAACEAARRMAIAAGDEFLVALPESMPVLADLVDDENEAVEAAARALVRALETLSGEPIFEQLAK